MLNAFNSFKQRSNNVYRAVEAFVGETYCCSDRKFGEPASSSLGNTPGRPEVEQVPVPQEPPRTSPFEPSPVDRNDFGLAPVDELGLTQPVLVPLQSPLAELGQGLRQVEPADDASPSQDGSPAAASVSEQNASQDGSRRPSKDGRASQDGRASVSESGSPAAASQSGSRTPSKEQVSPSPQSPPDRRAVSPVEGSVIEEFDEEPEDTGSPQGSDDEKDEGEGLCRAPKVALIRPREVFNPEQVFDAKKEVKGFYERTKRAAQKEEGEQEESSESDEDFREDMKHAKRKLKAAWKKEKTILKKTDGISDEQKQINQELCSKLREAEKGREGGDSQRRTARSTSRLPSTNLSSMSFPVEDDPTRAMSGSLSRQGTSQKTFLSEGTMASPRGASGVSRGASSGVLSKGLTSGSLSGGDAVSNQKTNADEDEGDKDNIDLQWEKKKRGLMREDWNHYQEKPNLENPIIPREDTGAKKKAMERAKRKHTSPKQTEYEMQMEKDVKLYQDSVKERVNKSKVDATYMHFTTTNDLTQAVVDSVLQQYSYCERFDDLFGQKPADDAAEDEPQDQENDDALKIKQSLINLLDDGMNVDKKKDDKSMQGMQSGKSSVFG